MCLDFLYREKIFSPFSPCAEPALILVGDFKNIWRFFDSPHQVLWPCNCFKVKDLNSHSRVIVLCLMKSDHNCAWWEFSLAWGGGGGVATTDSSSSLVSAKGKDWQDCSQSQ